MKEDDVSLLTSTTAQFGVYFTQQQDMYVPHSSWLVTLTVDLAPYDDQITIISDELQALLASLDALTKSSKNLPTTDETRMWREESVPLISDFYKLSTRTNLYLSHFFKLTKHH